MRIRRADEDDLLPLAGVFAATASDLLERYRPEGLEHLSLDPQERLPIYRHLLATGAVFVAEDPEPVGFAAAVVRDGVWFLSQLWVLPERHGAGTGSALIDEALAWGEGCSAFTTIASPHPAAQTLYLRRSMFPMWVQMEFVGRGEVPEMPDGVTPLADQDGSWVEDLDREVRGTARPEDHAYFRRGAQAFAFRRDGEPAGYVYLWPGGKVGPGAVRVSLDVAVLLRAALHLSGGALAVAVPSTNWAALGELTRLGMRLVGSNTFMASRAVGDATRYLSSGGALG